MMADSSMFEGFLKKARVETPSNAVGANAAVANAAGNRPAGFRHLQVRLVSDDAKRLKALADKRDLTIQDVLVEAVNLLLADWNEQPVGNPGTTRKG